MGQENTGLAQLQAYLRSVEDEFNNVRGLRTNDVEEYSQYLRETPTRTVFPEYAGLMESFRAYGDPKSGGFFGGYQNQLLLNDELEKQRFGVRDTFYGESQQDLNELQKAVLARLTSKESGGVNGFPYQTAGTAKDGIYSFDRRTGESILAVPPSFSAMYDDAYEKAYTTAAAGGVLTRHADLDAHARNYAKQVVELARQQNPSGHIPTQGYLNPDPDPNSAGDQVNYPKDENGVVTTPLPPMQRRDYSKQGDLAGLISQEDPEGRLIPGVTVPHAYHGNPAYEASVQIGEELAARGASTPQPTAPRVAGDQIVLTPQQRKTQDGQAQNQTALWKTYDENLSALRAMNEAISTMDSILASGNNTSGQAHELLNKLGGWAAYIDDDGRLAKAVGNDAVYYANMMDLVRDKIQALGAGTAVSNLDLIVTQKSVGDLRNPDRGNARLLAEMKLSNATAEALTRSKMSWFDKYKTFEGWKHDKSPTHALIERKVVQKNGRLFSTYDPIDKNSWLERAKVTPRGSKMTPAQLNAEWKRFADESVKRIW